MDNVLQWGNMARPLKENRSMVQDTTLTLRLSTADRTTLDRLVEREAEALADRGIEVTAASFVRGLIRREARTLGEAMGEPLTDTSAPRPPKPTVTAKPKSDPGINPDDVRERIGAAVKAGISQAKIARTAGINPGHLSRFITRQGGLSGERLREVDTALRSLKF